MREKNLYECHVFICTQKKEEGRDCCFDKGSAGLRLKLKDWATQKYGKRVRVNASGCLGFCSQGIATVAYPEGQWLLQIKETDLEKIQECIDEAMGNQK